MIAVWSIVQCFWQHSYVLRPQTYLETNFWRYSAVDGNWWYQNESDVKRHYCDRKHWWANDSSYGIWGSDQVRCRAPVDERTTFFYFDDNSAKVATSIAYGNELNATDIYLYQDVEKVTIAFQINYYNEVATEEVRGCRAFDFEGAEVESRRPAVALAAGDPEALQQDGVLLLSVEDILRATGKAWDDDGKEEGPPLPLRLQGIELIAEVKLDNYREPFSFSNATVCTVRFRVFRDQFTEVQRFYRGEELIGIQHGLRLRVIGSASLGYPSFVEGLTTVALGLCMATCLATLTEFVASMLHPRREEVNDAMCHPLNLGEKELQTASGTSEGSKKND